ncbi:DUF125-domain-containing protein [Daedalea quercina L-15889]|uniref:DUF125-domain-containing protein n=1 Tax=Daedalea quercina L-15889 TaxID=1314783 RepID=A0A165LY82_9APHY|nr:DUF125-domain-containing protein [Daedalea quercina L-15889]
MSYENSVAPAVPLPRQNGDISSKPPVWSINHTAGDQVPPTAKCDRHEPSRDGVCCKELIGDDERTLIDPDVVRDIVIGLSDGLTVPFALTAGLSSLGESKLVILGGIAELIAGAISMGIGGFLASQAERDHYHYLRKQTRARVLRSCEGEMEREVHAVLGPVGVDEKTSRAVAHCLMNVEVDSHGEGSTTVAGSETASRASTSDSEAGLRWSGSVGLSAFLLKFGEGLEEVPTRRLYTSAFTIGMGYLVGGLIPLLPYFFEPIAYRALIWSSVVTGIVLLVFGAVKARITGAGAGLHGYVWGAVSTLLVGGAAAAAAYGIVAALES